MLPGGGGADIAARLINIPLGEALGKPVIIENRGGAGQYQDGRGRTRMNDGHTLLVCSSAFVVNPASMPTWPMIRSGFEPIMVLGASPNAVFTVPATSPIQSLPS